MRLHRLEGRLDLHRAPEGRLRASGGAPRFLEASLQGRPPADAVYLVQTIGGDSGVSHALAAVQAWEAVAGVQPPRAGRLARELLHLLSVLHAHAQQFYFQVLPDYLPLSALADYDGGADGVRRLARGMAGPAGEPWVRDGFEAAFSRAERNRLLEHWAEAPGHLARLQRMMARLGGKFPMVMTLVPGGMACRLDADALLGLHRELRAVEPFLVETVIEDGLLLLERHPAIRSEGRGLDTFLSLGGVGGAGGDDGLFPRGLLAGGSLAAPERPITESVRHTFYAPAAPGAGGGLPVRPAPEKPGAYTWVKAARIGGEPAEVGAVARLIIARRTGLQGRVSGMAAMLEDHLQVPVPEANTVGGRILSRLAELDLLVRRGEAILTELEPDLALVTPAAAAQEAAGEGTGEVEAPAGPVRHRLVLERGRVRTCDIVAPSTWNGSPPDDAGRTGALERALAVVEGDIERPAVRHRLARIVHAFAFSAADAVH